MLLILKKKPHPLLVQRLHLEGTGIVEEIIGIFVQKAGINHAVEQAPLAVSVEPVANTGPTEVKASEILRMVQL